MTSIIIPVLFSIVTFFSTFTGGYFAIKRKNDLYLVLGFSGGALIGVSFFDLLPTAMAVDMEAINYLLVATVIGFLYYHIIQRSIAVHSHHKSIHEEPAQTMGKIGASGLVIHSFFDGFGIGASFQVNFGLGLIVALAVVFHDFSDGVNTVTLLLRHGNPIKAARNFLGADATAPMVGVAFSFLPFISASPMALSYILAFFAGEFLAIGAGDILPEAYAKAASYKLPLLTLLGVVMIFVVTRFV